LNKSDSEFHNPANDVVYALFGALRSIVHPVIVLILLLPMVIALLIWAGIGWLYWDEWTSGINRFVIDHSHYSWTMDWNIPAVAAWIAIAVVIVLLAPAILLTALLIATVFAMPVLVRYVAQDHYPALEKRHGGTFVGSAWNALAAIFLFLVLWVLTIPLWLLGPLAAVLPLLLSAWLNQRLFRYDALAEHADAGEMTRIFEAARGRLFLLGLATGLLYFIPPINLIAPVFAALAFIHLSLRELERLRSSELEVK
jgi:CysZ protein